MSNLSQLVRNLLNKSGTKQKDLAVILKKSDTTIGRKIKAGNFNQDELEQISVMLDIDISLLIDAKNLDLEAERIDSEEKFPRNIASWLFPLDYVGPVWTILECARQGRSYSYEYEFIWGPYKRTGSIDFTYYKIHALKYHKKDRGKTFPIVVKVNEDCKIKFRYNSIDLDKNTLETIIDDGWLRKK